MMKDCFISIEMGELKPSCFSASSFCAAMVIFFLRGGGLQGAGCMMLCMRVVPAALFLVGDGDPEAVKV
jgi:hypothetical protein